MSDIENLSNDELRVQLLKYGFQNMPVTQTTRKVLLKKLKVAIEMRNSKTRRDTVAVMKASDDDDEPLAELIRSKKEKTPRRATVGVIEKTKKVPATTTTRNGIETPPKSKSPSRRSSRATPSKDKPIVSSSASSLPEQSDDDIIEVMESPAAFARRSKSKTPTSLSKGETVRVSHYGSNVRNIPIVREEDTSTEEEEKSFEIEFQQPAPIITNRRTTTTTAMSYNNKPAIITPTKYGLTSNFQSSYIPASYTLSDEQGEEDDAEELNAPYLSNFAKRLSTLKAEPLDAGMKKYKKATDYNYGRNIAVPSTSTYRYSSSQYNKGAPVLEESRDGVLQDMAREFDKIDKKFSVRQYVYACLIVMIIVAIYVILFT